METNIINNKVREFHNEISNKKNGFRPRTGNILKKEDDNTLRTNEGKILNTCVTILKHSLTHLQKKFSIEALMTS